MKGAVERQRQRTATLQRAVALAEQACTAPSQLPPDLDLGSIPADLKAVIEERVGSRKGMGDEEEEKDQELAQRRLEQEEHEVRRRRLQMEEARRQEKEREKEEDAERAWKRRPGPHHVGLRTDGRGVWGLECRVLSTPVSEARTDELGMRAGVRSRSVDPTVSASNGSNLAAVAREAVGGGAELEAAL
eukprot:699468-Rhodomonas_salina.1